MEESFKLMIQLSVVIPVYNESALIQELINRVKKNIEKITNQYEIILIDDGSSDETWLQISSQSYTNSKIKGLKLSRNFGHHYAISAGLQKALGEWVVVMDGDLQDRPEVIPELYEKAISGFEVVFVSRQNRPEKKYYQLLQKIFYITLRLLSGIKFDSTQANFSIINRKVVDAFNGFPEYSRFYGSTISWLGFRRASIKANHGIRFAGKPSYTLKKRIKLASDIIIAFSDRPLKFAVGLGTLVSILSIAGAGWIVYSAIVWGYSVTGWTSLIFSIFFFSGILLTVLGIIGIYLGRVFAEVKHRPLFIISDKVNLE